MANIGTKKLDVSKIMKDFNAVEKSNAHRKGTFKINEPFGEAVDKILSKKSSPKRSKP